MSIVDRDKPIPRASARARSSRSLGACATLAAVAAVGVAAPEPLRAFEAPPDPSAQVPGTERFVEPRGDLTLREALAAALLRSPALAADSWEVRAREAAELQAGVLPNPDLQVSIEDVGLGKRSAFASPNQTSVMLSELVELGGKRSARLRLAGSERDLALWDYEVRRVSVLAETTKRFLTVLATAERQALANGLVDLAEESARSVAAAVGAGALSPVEKQRADLAVARARLDAARLQHDLDGARVMLAAAWGSDRPVFSRVVGDLETVVEPPPLEAVTANVARNPDVARWSAEIATREAEIDVEKSRRVPDVTVGGGMRRFDDGRSAFLLEGSVPLPLFNRNDGAILAARHRLARARTEQEATRVATVAALGAAYQNLLAAYGQVGTIRHELLPQATSAYQGSLDGFRKGLFRAIEVLDAQRALFEVRGQYLQALAEYHGTAADVERLAGQSLDAPRRERP